MVLSYVEVEYKNVVGAAFEVMCLGGSLRICESIEWSNSIIL